VAALDAFLPEFDANEVHAVEVDAEPAAALAALLAGAAAPGLAPRLLLRLRGVQAPASVAELLASLRFEVLHEEPADLVLGASGRPWTPRGGIGPFAAAAAGDVRVAVDVRAVPAGDGRSVLSTETRIAAVDEPARRAFRRYWRVVGPFSALIRRRWLRDAQRRLAPEHGSAARPGR